MAQVLVSRLVEPIISICAVTGMNVSFCEHGIDKMQRCPERRAYDEFKGLFRGLDELDQPLGDPDPYRTL